MAHVAATVQLVLLLVLAAALANVSSVSAQSRKSQPAATVPKPSTTSSKTIAKTGARAAAKPVLKAGARIHAGGAPPLRSGTKGAVIQETGERVEETVPPAPPASAQCPKDYDTQQHKKTTFTDTLKTTVSIHPDRPSAKVPLGGWIQGRATYYGTDERIEASRVACGEPAGQFGIIAQGSCGYTNSDGSLPFPREMYAAAADTNEDYPGSCGRCYQVRCKTGAVYNNGRPLRISDLLYYRPYEMKDNFGRDFPGNPVLEDDIFFTKCWDDTKVVTVRVGDSCPCQYPIKATGEIRTQNWCCGGQNHLDLSFWAFEQLAHPSYGVIPIEYRPVACDSATPLLSLPGYVNQTIFDDSIQPGWTWMPYNSKNNVLRAKGEGVDGGAATCASLSEGGAVQFLCRQCSRPGYQPFAKAEALRFSVRSNTKSTDPFASSTPAGQLPGLKVFLMNADKGTYCGKEVVLAADSAYTTKSSRGWYNVRIPLSAFDCEAGSVGGLAAVDRVDFQNTNIRDADVCLDKIAIK